jgi:hypothetical protein
MERRQARPERLRQNARISVFCSRVPQPGGLPGNEPVVERSDTTGSEYPTLSRAPEGRAGIGSKDRRIALAFPAPRRGASGLGGREPVVSPGSTTG